MKAIFHFIYDYPIIYFLILFLIYSIIEKIEASNNEK